MSTIVVWVLILWTGNGPVVIDNIASEQNCRGVISAWNEPNRSYYTGKCIAVRKIKL